jgi:hypothetical protein
MWNKAKEIGGDNLGLTIIGGIGTLLAIIMTSIGYGFVPSMMTSAAVVTGATNISQYPIMETLTPIGVGLVLLIWAAVTMLGFLSSGAAGISAFRSSQNGNVIQVAVMSGIAILLSFIMISITYGVWPNIITSAELVRLHANISDFPLVGSLNPQIPGLLYLGWLAGVIVSMVGGFAGLAVRGYQKFGRRLVV